MSWVTPLHPTDADDVRFNVVACELHIYDRAGRMYAFDAFDTQVRCNWCRDRGSFTLVAEEYRWMRAPGAFERVAPRASLL